jgi:outer membrane protein OmpA-like peptidoglycan-associated protein
LQENSDFIVSIKGYASPEGNAEFNQELSTKRANAVKDVLVKQYGIDASRIVTQGEGVGNMFSEPAWNRISIITIEGTD